MIPPKLGPRVSHNAAPQPNFAENYEARSISSIQRRRMERRSLGV